MGPVATTEEPVDRQLAALIAADDGPSLSLFMAKQGTLEQWREYLTLRSVYHLKEGDPHTFAIPRLSGRAKAAMVEIQADEYGGGSPQRMHSELFAGLMRDLDLDAGYGALWDDAPAAAFASVNTMSLFGLHRRWRGAALGHLAAVEMTSSEPSRRYSAGLRRLGFDERVTVFYDEHVEADAVHEQIASVDMCGSLVAEEPDLAARRPLRRRLLAGHGRRRRAAPARRLGVRPLGAARGTAPRRLIVTPRVGAPSRRICAAGRGRLGALGAENPDRLCVPSQKGLMPDFPHRHSAMVSRPGSISAPSWSTSRKSPRTISGPSR